MVVLCADLLTWLPSIVSGFTYNYSVFNFVLQVDTDPDHARHDHQIGEVGQDHHTDHHHLHIIDQSNFFFFKLTVIQHILDW